MLRALVLSAFLVGFAAVDDKKDEKKSGTVAGVVTAKEKNWIEVKAAGEEKARKYFLRGDTSAELKQAIKDVPTGSRVRIEWSFLERPRVIKLEILKK